MVYREDIPGWMNKQDFIAIEALASCVPPEGILVEIGSYLGRSSWAWAQSVLPSVKVYCIDPWPENLLPEFKENVKDCPNITPIQGYSPTMPWNKDLKPDLVFIDGNHYSPHVDNDLIFWSQQLKQSGILCGHDFNPFKWPDVCRAVIKQAKLLKKPFKIFEGSSVWYIELNQEDFSVENRDCLINRIGLQDISWEPTCDEIQYMIEKYLSH